MTARRTIATAAAALAIAGCGPRSDAPAPTAAVAPYVSVATGFRFTPPPSWPIDRFLVSEIAGPEAARREPGAQSIAEIQYQPVDLGHRPEILVRVHVLSDSAYEKREHEGGSILGGVMARARGRTYLAATAQANPYPPGGVDAKSFEAMRLAVSDLKRWFSVADAASDLASEFLPGTPTFGPAPALYRGTLPAASGGKRDVTLIFRADSTALLSTDTGGKGRSNRRGRWSLEGVYVRLQLIDDAGQPTEAPFLWAIRDSSLAPVTWDRGAWGSVGLPLRLRP
jgi:hypothetical protein